MVVRFFSCNQAHDANHDDRKENSAKRIVHSHYISQLIKKCTGYNENRYNENRWTRYNENRLAQ